MCNVDNFRRIEKIGEGIKIVSFVFVVVFEIEKNVLKFQAHTVWYSKRSIQIAENWLH